MTMQNEAHITTRRRFLHNSAALALGATLLPPAEILAKLAPETNLSFYHTHTREIFQLCYLGNSCPPQLKKGLNVFFRDFRTGDIHPMDFRLMNILARIKHETGSKGVFEIISAYRSPKTNKALRSKSGGVAKKSFHLKGQALDVRLTDLPTTDLRDVAISLKAGGVGYYADSDFVHLDTGHVRSW